MLSREHGKQNLCSCTEGHCTKCVSSSRSWHRVHLRVAAAAAGAAAGAAPAAELAGGVWLDEEFESDAEPLPRPGSGTPFATASLELTVVELTCRLPDDLRPLDEPASTRERVRLVFRVRFSGLCKCDQGHRE